MHDARIRSSVQDNGKVSYIVWKSLDITSSFGAQSSSKWFTHFYSETD
jgi:hypothetical protein